MAEMLVAERLERMREERDMLHAPEPDEVDYRDWLDAQSYEDEAWDLYDDWSDDYAEPDAPLPGVVASWLDGSLADPNW